MYLYFSLSEHPAPLHQPLGVTGPPFLLLSLTTVRHEATCVADRSDDEIVVVGLTPVPGWASHNNDMATSYCLLAFGVML